MTERERLLKICEEGHNAYLKDQNPNPRYDEFLADYLLANGVIVPPSEHVYFIVDKGTKYAMAMPKRTDELPLYKLRDLEKYGYYLSKEEAEKALHKINHNSLCETETYKIKQ